jgi:hypothetical protein
LTDPTKRWVVRVYWETPETLDQDEVDQVLGRLQGHSAVIGRHPIDGIWEATVSVQAPDLESAGTLAFELVAGATTATPVSAEVLREHLRDRREAIRPL